MSLSSPSDWVVVGRFGRTHGVRGLISVISFTDPVEQILKYKNWFFFRQGEYHPVVLLDKAQSRKIFVHVKDFEDTEKAAALTNLDIFIKREELPSLKKGEYYWHDLIGLDVVNQKSKSLGVVTEILPTGSNDVLIVESKGEKPILIPYLPDSVILDIDLKTKTICVDWEPLF